MGSDIERSVKFYTDILGFKEYDSISSMRRVAELPVAARGQAE
jgi:catechol 2,3-dioxygenase-like lactoylglutathione lyase family enzyme